jgi:hypothetical protein
VIHWPEFGRIRHYDEAKKNKAGNQSSLNLNAENDLWELIKSMKGAFDLNYWFSKNDNKFFSLISAYQTVLRTDVASAHTLQRWLKLAFICLSDPIRTFTSEEKEFRALYKASECFDEAEKLLAKLSLSS